MAEVETMLGGTGEISRQRQGRTSRLPPRWHLHTSACTGGPCIVAVENINLECVVEGGKSEKGESARRHEKEFKPEWFRRIPFALYIESSYLSIHPNFSRFSSTHSIFTCFHYHKFRFEMTNIPFFFLALNYRYI